MNVLLLLQTKLKGLLTNFDQDIDLFMYMGEIVATYSPQLFIYLYVISVTSLSRTRHTKARAICWSRLVIKSVILIIHSSYTRHYG